MDKKKDGFNKLQWSMFVGDSQYVVRCNDMTEFIKLIGDVQDFVVKQPKNAPLVTNKPLVTQKPMDTAMRSKLCPVHGVASYEKTGKYGTFFSHFDKEHGYCNDGKGYKDEKQY